MKYLGPPQSGSLANQVASRNPYGQYFRERIIPIDPATPAQISSRAVFSVAVGNWATLTDDQRQAWNVWGLTFRRSGNLVDGLGLSGQAAFISATMVAAEHGLSLPTDPPGAQPTWTLSLAEVDLSGGAVVANWTAAAGARVGLFFTPPTPPTRAFSSAKRPKLLATSVAAGTEDVTVNYLSFFGSLPASGQSVYLVAREISELRLSPPLVARDVAP